MNDIRRIHATFDPESSVWWAESDDLPGLVTEAATFDALVERVAAVAPELLATNGQIPAGPVTLEFLATRQVQMA